MIITDKLVQLWKDEYPEQSSDFPKFYNWEEKMIAVSDIGFHQPENMDKAKRYLKLMEDGTEFPPLVALYKGPNDYWLIDGFHRIWAATRRCHSFVKVYVGHMRN